MTRYLKANFKVKSGETPLTSVKRNFRESNKHLESFVKNYRVLRTDWIGTIFKMVDATGVEPATP